MSNYTNENLSKDQVEGWIRDFTWIVYAIDTRMLKKMYIAVGTPCFKVTHGKEIIYEGPGMAHALEVYNKIKALPVDFETPKLDN